MVTFTHGLIYAVTHKADMAQLSSCVKPQRRTSTEYSVLQKRLYKIIKTWAGHTDVHCYVDTSIVAMASWPEEECYTPPSHEQHQQQCHMDVYGVGARAYQIGTLYICQYI